MDMYGGGEIPCFVYTLHIDVKEKTSPSHLDDYCAAATHNAAAKRDTLSNRFSSFSLHLFSARNYRTFIITRATLLLLKKSKQQGSFSLSSLATTLTTERNNESPPSGKINSTN